MTHDLAVVRLDVLTGKRMNVGTVVEDLGGSYLVQWDGGTVREEVTPSDEDRVVVRGSLPFLALVSPDRLRLSFDADPVAVFIRVLRDVNKPLKSSQIRTYLTKLGLDRAQVWEAWTAEQTAFQETAQVIVDGSGSGQTYRWTEEAASVPEETGGGQAPPRLRTLKSLLAPARRNPHIEESAVPEEPTVQPGEISEPAPTLAELIAAAASRAADDITPAQYDAFAELLERYFTEADPVEPSSLAGLVDVAAAVADGGPAYTARLEFLAEHIAELTGRAVTEHAVRVDLGRLAAVASVLPWQPYGGRVAVLRAVAATWPEELTAPRWWTGVTLAELAVVARAGLGAVTSREDVSAQVVLPLVQAELATVTSLPGLAAIFALPREFVAGLPAESVVTVLRRIGGEDQAVAAWLQALAGPGESTELHEARAAAESAAEAAEREKRRADDLVVRCERLEGMLRSEHTQAVQLRSAQDRQIRIDGIRALAELAAEVEELATDRLDGRMLVERVRMLASAHDLEPLGEAGTEAPFDPVIHDPLADSPQAGTTVTVIRPGYRWRPSDEDVLLDRALVTIT